MLFVFVIVVVNDDDIVVVVVIVDKLIQKILALKFGQNWVNNKL